MNNWNLSLYYYLFDNLLCIICNSNFLYNLRYNYWFLYNMIYITRFLSNNFLDLWHINKVIFNILKLYIYFLLNFIWDIHFYLLHFLNLINNRNKSFLKSFNFDHLNFNTVCLNWNLNYSFFG